MTEEFVLFVLVGFVELPLVERDCVVEYGVSGLVQRPTAVTVVTVRRQGHHALSIAALPRRVVLTVYYLFFCVTHEECVEPQVKHFLL